MPYALPRTNLHPARFLFALALSLVISACGGGGGGSAAPVPTPTPAPTLTAISLSPSGPTLAVGGSTDLQATGTFSDGSTVTPYDSQVTWTSSAPGTASVTASGLVTGNSVGTATITAAKNAVQATATVTVNAAGVILTSITLNPAAGATLNIGQTADFTATAHWSNGTTTTPYDSTVSWTTNLPSVATVNAAGLVTAVAAGSAILTASANGLNTTAAITVNATSPTLSSISLNPTTATLNVGQTVDITSTANWSNGTSTVPYDSNVTWTSSAPSVATVNAGGVVTGVAGGTATITASAAGKSATATITVTSGPTLISISLDIINATLNVGQTVDITSTANWSNGTSTVPYDSYLTWTSSAPSVATVNAGGVVTGVAAGTATITASLNGISKTAAITVSTAAPTLTSITLNATTATGTRGQTMDLTATGHFSDGSTVTPYDAQVTWVSNAPGVATVNSAGLVTAVWRGTAIISASKNGLSAACTITVSDPFDTRLIGTWRYVGFPNPIDLSNSAAQYILRADGTFTYFITYDSGTAVATYGVVEGVHIGSFTNTANQLVFNCTSHVTNYYGSDKRTLVYQAPMTPGIHAHTELSLPYSNVLRSRNDGFDFMNTGLIDYTKQ